MYDKDYNPIFRTEILIEGVSAGKGTGSSKKESQQSAARTALKKLKNDKQFCLTLQEAKERNHAAQEETMVTGETQQTGGEKEADETSSE